MEKYIREDAVEIKKAYRGYIGEEPSDELCELFEAISHFSKSERGRSEYSELLKGLTKNLTEKM